MAAGCNVIVSDVGGLSEVVDHQRTGQTVLVDDPQSIVWAVEQLFSDPVLAQKMREEALREALDIYNWRTIASSTLETYRSVVAHWQDVNW